MEPISSVTFTQIFVNQIVPLLITVISGLVAVAIAKFNKWIKTKTDSEKVLSTMDTVFQITETAVANANSTIVQGLKEAAADGKITKEEADKIKNDVLNQIKNTIPNESKKVMSKVVADLDVYLGNLIEKMVLDAKHDMYNK